jgi:PAS domain S-box-containing protein
MATCSTSTVRSIRAERRVMLQTLLIGGGALAASLLATLLLTSVLTRGLRQLAAASERIGRGDTDVRLSESGDQEVLQLTAAFNAMSRELGSRMAALQESEARQRSLVEALAEGVVFQDADTRVLSCNEAAPRILGLTRNQLLGLDPMDPRWRAIRRDGSPFAPQDHPSMRALKSGQPQRDVLMSVERADGTRAWILVNSEPLTRPGESAPYAAVTSFNDITARVEAEDRLRQMNAELEARVVARTADLVAARDAAERASQAKSEFLSRMSHELRTPLNAILGFAQVLQLNADRPEIDTRASIAHIERAGWHLLDLINEVLDLSRIEAGAMSVSLEPVTLAPLAAECLRLAGPLAAERGVTLHLGLDLRSGVAAVADRVRLRQVLVNLMSNAIKYNRRGGEVRIDARPEPATGGRAAQVAISVADTGRGFTPEQRAQLYQPFNRLGAERYAPGTGIGLVITKRLTDLMQGTLELQTEPGVGSTFTLRLPAVTAVPAAAGAPAPTIAAGADAPSAAHTLVYIEDNPSNAELLKGVVALRPGLRIEVAADGRSGLALARRVLPSMIIVDIGLPDIDGYEVCRHLRADPALSKRPIVALTANAMEADRARGALAGFDAYLTKPLDVAAFLRYLDRLLEARR